jgi:hypothetical protein
MEPFALKRPSLQGRMSWIESGTMIGLIDRKDEYQESSRRSPVINLTGQWLETNKGRGGGHTVSPIQPCSKSST